jgi:hypothetical protein
LLESGIAKQLFVSVRCDHALVRAQVRLGTGNGPGVDTRSQRVRAVTLDALLEVAFAAIRWRTASSRALALVNPIVVTIAIVLASMPSEWLRSFAAPASANLAHVAFYLFWSVPRLGRAARVE